MQQELITRLKERYAEFTNSEKALATYFLNHMHALPFETIGSISRQVEVSEMTAIRFVRSLGYKNFKALKASLKGSFATGDDSLDNLRNRFKLSQESKDVLNESLQLEIQALIDVYELARTELWRKIVKLLSGTSHVYVVGFQATKGLAMDFATRLQWVRTGIQFVDGISGTYIEVLGEQRSRSALVLIDTAAYALDSFRLAAKAREIELPLVIVSDKFSHWPHEYTDLVLQASSFAKTFWDSEASLAALLNLLTNSIAVQLGSKAGERFQQASELGDHFKAFDYSVKKDVK
jgi:DNA-binding MurR/RpiR family transcriptional regulator